MAVNGERVSDRPVTNVVPATPSHLEGMARCHIACFPDKFISRMGVPFARAFYESYLQSSQGLAFVALAENAEVVGLVAGGDPGIREDFMSGAIRRFLGRLLLKALVDRVVRSAILQRLFRPAGRGRQASEWPLTHRDNWAKLQVICLRADHRGTGAAGRLMAAFLDGCKQAGWTTAALSVDVDNTRAVAFYKKLQWQVLLRQGDTVYMERRTSPK